MDFLEVLNKRVTSRKFLKEEISDDEINALLDAANKSPISKGKYGDSRITVIKNKKLIEDISKEYKEKSDKLIGKLYDPLYDAPLFILFSSKRDSNAKYQDAGCVLENIALMATSMDLGSCYIRGVIDSLGSDAKYIERLNLEDGFYPVAGILIGKVKNELKGKTHEIKANVVE